MYSTLCQELEPVDAMWRSRGRLHSVHWTCAGRSCIVRRWVGPGRPGCESCPFDSCDTIIITMVAGRARQATGTAAVVNHNGASLLASCLAVTVVTCSLPFASAAIRVA